MTKPIVLIGPPASGKSTVAKIVAERANMKLIDTDRRIEEHTRSASVGDYLSKVGERTFRATERAMLVDALLYSILTPEKSVIISTGAGIVEDPLNREDMRSHGVPVCLFVPVSALHDRMVGDDTRPLWTGPGGKEALRERWKRRAPMYQETASFIVNATAPPEHVANSVLRCVGHA